jgi:hypothetical protein
MGFPKGSPTKPLNETSCGIIFVFFCALMRFVAVKKHIFSISSFSQLLHEKHRLCEVNASVVTKDMFDLKASIDQS